MRGLGTLVNLAAVLAGGLLGLFVGDRMPERYRRTILAGLGLVTLGVGIVGLDPLRDPDDGLRRAVILIVAMVGGGMAGEALRLEDRLESFAERVRARVARPRAGKSRADHGRFVEGFVVASTVFCVGPLTVLGSIQDGLGRGISSLAIKSTLDGFAAMGFASVYGAGVLASLITILVYQGGITLAAVLVEPLMTAEVIAQLEVTGSLLILGIGLRLLDVARLPIVGLMPALILGPALAGLVAALS